jgi:predicted acylesterase/phospholipase RssA
MTIRHLVISGGGQTGFTFYGILKEAEKQGFWNINDIKSMYGTSIGTFISVMLCLKYDWETLDDYFIKRPWQEIFKIDLYSVIQSFEKRGIFNVQTMENMMGPLFAGVDIPMSITMKEFYDINGIELHFFTTELNTFKLVNISHKTHPDWRVIDAVYASCTLPIIFAPLIRSGECYIDGGALCSYPMKTCIADGSKVDEIFGVKKSFLVDSSITESSSLFDYLMVVFKNIIIFMNGFETGLIPNEILVNGDHITIDNILSLSISKEERQKNIEIGEHAFIVFSEKRSIALPD